MTDHSDTAGTVESQYPFDPYTAFQFAGDRAQFHYATLMAAVTEKYQDHNAAVSRLLPPTESEVVLPSQSPHGQSRARVESLAEGAGIEAVDIPERSLLGESFGLEVVHQPDSAYVPENQDDFSPLPGEEEEQLPTGTLSRTSNSLRSYLSRRASTLRSRNSLRSRPSLRSQNSVRSGRWSFLGQRRRSGDLEDGFGGSEFSNFVQSEAVELDAQDVAYGPFELSALTREERRSGRTTAPAGTLKVPRSDLQIVEDLFGLQLCGPQYTRVRRAYMQQLDKRLEDALRDYEVQNPNATVWPKPFTYLVSHLSLVARHMDPSVSVTCFVLSHINDFTKLIRTGTMPIMQEKDGFEDFLNEDRFSEWYNKLAHEWMLFALESWTMIDFSPLIEDRHNLMSSTTFCESTVGEILKSSLPRSLFQSERGAQLAVPSTIAPAELTASMLQDWQGIHFSWTNNLSEHLDLDRKTKVVKVYSHVAFAYLHTVARDNSSLNKTGFTEYHRLLTEVVDSYRILFGSDRRSQVYFGELDIPNRSVGYINIFASGSAETEPRFLYNIGADFPVYGERLLVLKHLLKPTGLSGLWRDKRDSLQWYTFWAVVLLGGVGLLLGIIQMALGAVQAYASMAALQDQRKHSAN